MGSASIQRSIHIGNIIKEELARQERSVSWFARKLNCDRSNVYKIFKRSAIDTELLIRISFVLQCNFFSVFQNEMTGLIGKERHESVDRLTIR